jgi:hypothetical protein
MMYILPVTIVAVIVNIPLFINLQVSRIAWAGLGWAGLGWAGLGLVWFVSNGLCWLG